MTYLININNYSNNNDKNNNKIEILIVYRERLVGENIKNKVTRIIIERLHIP